MYIIKMNIRSSIVRQNIARNSQCFHKKPNQSTTGYGVDDTSKGKSLFLAGLDKENSQIGVAFSFHKAQKDNKQF